MQVCRSVCHGLVCSFKSVFAGMRFYTDVQVCQGCLNLSKHAHHKFEVFMTFLKGLTYSGWFPYISKGCVYFGLHSACVALTDFKFFFFFHFSRCCLCGVPIFFSVHHCFQAVSCCFCLNPFLFLSVVWLTLFTGLSLSLCSVSLHCWLYLSFTLLCCLYFLICLFANVITVTVNVTFFLCHCC